MSHDADEYCGGCCPNVNDVKTIYCYERRLVQENQKLRIEKENLKKEKDDALTRLEKEISDFRKHTDDLEREMVEKDETIEELTRRLEIERQARKDDAWQHTQNTSKIKDDLMRVETEKQDALTRDIQEKDVQIATLKLDLENTRQVRANDVSRYEQQIFKLKEDLSRVEATKDALTRLSALMSVKPQDNNPNIAAQDALTRLSALMAVKLRDNNPNIADLIDQFRPTKLAEMFSELYDNEWTDAFTAVNKDLSERQTITFLLDIIMGAYSFCTEEIDMSWSVVSEWYLDPSLPNEQQMRKLLKDARKVAVLKMTDQISKRYQTRIQSICSVPTLLEMLSTDAVGCYVMQSLRLCLLMCANDPPVVIKCQDVIEEACGDLKQSNGANTSRQAVGNDKVINAETEEKEVTHFDEEKTHTEGQNVVDTGLTDAEFQNNLDEQATEEESKNEEQASGAVNTDNEQPSSGETNTEGSQISGAMREIIENESIMKNNPKRQPFDRDKFKEYTSRGPYLEYVVWPVMYLHQVGPMLGKGVAQGTSESVCRWEEEQWTWKNAE